MTEVLIIAAQTLSGSSLMEAVRSRAASGETTFRLVVPMTKPAAGLVIYDDAVRDAAQVRVDLALAVVAAEGISGTGEVGDSDPFSAAMDAIADHRPDEIIISTKPIASSGWLRRDLIERVENASGLPVTHLVTDLEREELPIRTTLVIANRTSSGDELIDYLKAKAAGSTGHVFIGVVPQQGGAGSLQARERLTAMLTSLHAAGLFAAGMVGDPDPYIAAINALALFRVDDLVISTLPDERSGWLRSQLIERLQRATTTPVEHVVVEHAASPTATG